MGNEIEVIQQGIGMVCWTPKEVMAQIQVIQQLMRDGMTEGEHWGKIPGCGDKPALLKPGAEKLGLMFRLAGKYETQEVNLPNGHLDVKVKCSLIHIVNGNFWGEGLGSCSTMESKYRYRSGVGESTQVQVPKAYWDMRRANPKEAQIILGGPGYTTKKGEEGLWWIYEKIDKVENPDIADTYNTVRKIAKKRAFVDAMLSATAASDIFTQDIDEMFGQPETQEKKDKKEAIKAQEAVVVESQAPEPPKNAPESPQSVISTEQQLEIIKLAKERGVTQSTLKKYLKETLGVDGWSKIPASSYLEVYSYLDGLSAEVGA
jgi:hypothetical protein